MSEEKIDTIKYDLVTKSRFCKFTSNVDKQLYSSDELIIMLHSLKYAPKVKKVTESGSVDLTPGGFTDPDFEGLLTDTKLHAATHINAIKAYNMLQTHKNKDREFIMPKIVVASNIDINGVALDNPSIKLFFFDEEQPSVDGDTKKFLEEITAEFSCMISQIKPDDSGNYSGMECILCTYGSLQNVQDGIGECVATNKPGGW